jgi:hypothetical protein
MNELCERKPAMRLLVAAILVLASAGVAAAQAPWPAELANPKPMPDDLVLPMPCGGQIVFRPVVVPVENLLDDRRISLGTLDKEYGYKEFQHADYISAGFSAPGKSGGRIYYLGKYDVTRLQFASLGSPCPAPDDQSRMPQTSISWNDAEDFADHLTQWLITNAKDKLPVEDGQPGFLRLPTEEEWEFAARGGAKVSVADFAGDLFPMSGPLEKYVWFGGTESSNNQLQPVGLLQPNPLGLYDTLGNASQFSFALFRLNRLARLHGDAGAYVDRGGNYLTPREQIRVSARDEFVPYDARGKRALKTVGFRVALVAPALPSVARLRAIETAWERLPSSTGGTLAEPVQDDPIKEVDALAKATDDPQLKHRLESLGLVIAANIKTRDDQRDRATRVSMELAVWLADKMERDVRRLIGREEAAAAGQGLNNDTTKRFIAGDEQELRSTIGYYRDTLRTIYTEYPDAVRQAQSAILATELDQRGEKPQAALVPLIRTDVAAMQTNGDLPTDAVELRLRRALCATNDGATVFADACRNYRR